MKKKNNTWIHAIIGLVIMLIGFFMPAAGQITQMGMRIIFIFVGMVYLWSTVNEVWCSLIGLVFLGLTQYMGEGSAGFTAVFSSALGNDTVWTMIFLSVLFGAMEMTGAMRYVARWLMTRKAICGKPYFIMAMVALTAYILSFIANPMAALIVTWSINKSICEAAGIERKDPLWKYIFGLIFLAAGVGQPGLPFKGVGLGMTRVFQNVTKGEFVIGTNGYMLFNIIMSFVMIACFLLLVRFVFRPDVSKLKNLDLDSVGEAFHLLPANKAQKILLWTVPIFLVLVIVPTLGNLKKLPVFSTLSTVGVLGIACVLMVILSLLRVDGKPVLRFGEVAKNKVLWNVILMMGVGITFGSALGDQELGIIPTIRQVISPIVAGKPAILVVLFINLVAIILTNLAANAAMSNALVPVIVAIATHMGLNPAPISMGVMMIVFIAMMTPSASPAASQCYGQLEYYSAREIRSYALPISIIAVIVYTFIGYPLASVLVGL